MKRAVALAAFLAAAPPFAGTPLAEPPLPRTLAETGFHARCKTEFTPNHPLWSDGAAKKRCLWLPPGTAIDKSNPDAWQFPDGTRFWKEFGFERPVETRYIERLPGGAWRFLTFVWNAEATEARLAAEDGEVVPLDSATAPVRKWQVPSRTDCLACHEGPAVPILGYGAVQLAPRPGPTGGDDLERRALGYLHGNCGHCHNDDALSGVGLVLAQRAASRDLGRERILASLVGRDSRFRAHRVTDARRVVPGRPRDSILVQRMQSTNPLARMPPLGVQAADAEGLALLERWIHSLDPSQEKRP